MEVAKKDDWVEIENLVLKPSDRATHLPEDTKSVPLMMWTKGFLVEDEGRLGEQVSVKTLSGRIATGVMTAINPRHVHDFGDPVPELMKVGTELRKELENL